MSGLSSSLPATAFSFVTASVTPETVTFRNGFQYTLLTRGSDIRRQPGITIRDVMNSQANTCTFTIDGSSNAPVVGELVQITDAFDGDRLLFAGTVQFIEQIYEGNITQLAWRVTCVDFTWLLNKRRPFGNYVNVSASAIVLDLMAKYAPPGFTTTHVQTKLAKISIQFSGQDDFGSCLTKIAQAIGGGHWDVDYTQDLHFFHVVPTALVVPFAAQADLGAYMTISQGNLLSTVSFFTFGYYFLRYTFVYSDGSESSFGAISNLLLMDGAHEMNVTGVPIGGPLGTLTCVKRRIYYNKLVRARDGDSPIETVLKCCEIGNNTTTSFTWKSGSVFSDVYPNIYAIDGAVAIPGSTNPGHPAAPVVAPGASLVITGPADGLWNGACVQFKYAYLYRDGSVSFPSQPSNTVKQLMVKGYGVKGYAVTNVQLGPVVAGNDVVARFIYYNMGAMNPANWSGNGIYANGFTQPVDFDEPTWANVGGGIAVLPDNSTDHLFLFSLAEYGFLSLASWGFASETVTPFDGVLLGVGNKPYNNGDILSTDPIPIWPNPDGPSLEAVDPPADLTNTNTSLLRDGAGNPFTVTTDLSQVRNRVFVVGSGTVTTATAEIGASQLVMGDISTMSPHGGKVRIEDPANGKQSYVNYRGVGGVVGNAYILLSSPLTERVVQGCSVNNFFQADDFNSQKYLAKVELDKNGAPTDGVHEYVIIDTSLKATFQLFMRAYAELELFAWPIITIHYSTRDPKTKSGQIVHVNMTDPPCQGDFLIQDVTIDQIHDESDSLVPRYTAQASSVRYELNDLLLAIITGANQQSLSGGGGIVQAAQSQTLTVIPTGFQAYTATITLATPFNLFTTPATVVNAQPGFTIVPLFWSISCSRNTGQWNNGTASGQLVYANAATAPTIAAIGWGLNASVVAGFHFEVASLTTTAGDSTGTYAGGQALKVKTGADITPNLLGSSASATITVYYILVPSA